MPSLKVLLWALTVYCRHLTEDQAWREAWVRGYIHTPPPGLHSVYPPNLEWAVRCGTRSVTRVSRLPGVLDV